MTRVLFVCLGNICRSPTAEAVFRAKADAQHTHDSAATSDWHIGAAPYGPMQDAARARGLQIADLAARQVRAADFDDFDLILGMDDKNLANLQAMAPPGARAQLGLLTDYGNTGADQVPDPYYTRDFDGALDLIERCIDGLVASLDKA